MWILRLMAEDSILRTALLPVHVQGTLADAGDSGLALILQTTGSGTQVGKLELQHAQADLLITSATGNTSWGICYPR